MKASSNVPRFQVPDKGDGCEDKADEWECTEEVVGVHAWGDIRKPTFLAYIPLGYGAMEISTIPNDPELTFRDKH
jgi:hypothetical protein